MLINVFNMIRKAKYRIISVFYSVLLKNDGDLKIYGRIFIENPRNLRLGKNITINDGVYINCRDKVYIGDNVRISAGTKIITTGLNTDFIHTKKAVRIMSNCWLGANSVILPGVVLHENTIVGSGAVVTKSTVVEGEKLLGIPARNINQHIH